MIDVRVISLIIDVITLFFILMSMLCNSNSLLFFAMFVLLTNMVVTFYSIYKSLID